MVKQSNRLATNDTAIETMQKLIQKLQGEIKTLKTSQEGHSNKKTISLGYKKWSLWSNPYFWTHGVGRNDG